MRERGKTPRERVGFDFQRKLDFHTAASPIGLNVAGSCPEYCKDVCFRCREIFDVHKPEIFRLLHPLGLDTESTTRKPLPL